MPSAAELRALLKEKIEADRIACQEREERRRKEQLALEEADIAARELLAQIAVAEAEEKKRQEAAERETKRKINMELKAVKLARLHAEQVRRTQSPAQASGSGLTHHAMQVPIFNDDTLPSGTEVKKKGQTARPNTKPNTKQRNIFVFDDDERCSECIARNLVCNVEEVKITAWEKDIAARKVFSSIPVGITCRNCDASGKTCFFHSWDDGDGDKKTADWENAIFKSAYQFGKGLRKLAEEQELAADGQERIANALERIVETFEIQADTADGEEMQN